MKDCLSIPYWLQANGNGRSFSYAHLMKEKDGGSPYFYWQKRSDGDKREELTLCYWREVKIDED